MFWLAPWYLMASVAVVLPLAWHFFHRSPSGVKTFSSLLFVQPSPPRWTRTRQFDDPLLFVLRSLAILGLALAFARPGWMTTAPSGEKGNGRRILFLVDASASMESQIISQQVTNMFNEDLAKLTFEDDVALYSFGESPEVVCGWQSVSESPDLGARRSMLQNGMKQITPQSQGSRLGRAVAFVAEEIRVRELNQPLRRETQIVIYSDYQEGSDFSGLKDVPLPDGVVLLPRRAMGTPNATNASLQIVYDGRASTERNAMQVRLSNCRHGVKDRFQLAWCDRSGKILNEAASREVNIDPGKLRVVRAPAPQPDNAFGLVITGDDLSFDNTLWIAPQAKEDRVILFLGDQRANDGRSLRYFLEKALFTTPTIHPVLQSPPLDAESEPPAAAPAVVVVSCEISRRWSDRIKEWMHSGSTILLVSPTSSGDQCFFENVVGETIPIKESNQDHPQFLNGLDFEDQWLRPFRAQNFADFSGIHFWKHRQVPSIPAGWKVLARFDGGDPAWISGSVGQGRVLWMTSSWRPDESQLARSPKFPLLLNNLFVTSRRTGVSAALTAGQTVSWPRHPLTKALATVVDPSGETEVPLNETPDPAFCPRKTGIYELKWGEEIQLLAVNLPASESATAMMTDAELTQKGFPLIQNSPAISSTNQETIDRQKSHFESERTQQFWRWLVLAVVVVLVLETLYAAYRLKWVLATSSVP